MKSFFYYLTFSALLSSTMAHATFNIDDILNESNLGIAKQKAFKRSLVLNGKSEAIPGYGRESQLKKDLVEEESRAFEAVTKLYFENGSAEDIANAKAAYVVANTNRRNGKFIFDPNHMFADEDDAKVAFSKRFNQMFFKELFNGTNYFTSRIGVHLPSELDNIRGGYTNRNMDLEAAKRVYIEADAARRAAKAQAARATAPKAKAATKPTPAPKAIAPKAVPPKAKAGPAKGAKKAPGKGAKKAAAKK